MFTLTVCKFDALFIKEVIKNKNIKPKIHLKINEILQKRIIKVTEGE